MTLLPARPSGGDINGINSITSSELVTTSLQEGGLWAPRAKAGAIRAVRRALGQRHGDHGVAEPSLPQAYADRASLRRLGVGFGMG